MGYKYNGKKRLFLIKEAVIFMSMLTEMGKQAKEAAVVLSVLPTPRKNKALCHAADALLAAKDEILAANKADV